MNKKKLLVFLLTIFSITFINTNKVYAASMSITCNKPSIEVGETATCTVSGTVEGPFNGATAAISSNSNIEVIESSMTRLAPEPLSGEMHIFYTSGTRTVPAGTYDLTSFTIRGLSPGTGTVMLRPRTGNSRMGFDKLNEDIYDTSMYEVSPVNYNITVTDGGAPQPVSSDSSLRNLAPNFGELDPVFTSDNFHYTMSADFTRAGSVSFAATKNNDYASVGSTTCEIPNSTSIQSITCDIIVTAQDQVTKSTYSIVINNSAYVEPIITNDIFIEELGYDISAVLIPDFVRDVFDYEMHVNFSNYREINFTTRLSEDGITVTGKKCTIPRTPNIESVTCNIHLTKNEKSANYKIVLLNTNNPDIKCDLIIKSNVYTIDQDKKIIKVGKNATLEEIKSNLYSSCGEISVFEDKVTIVDGANMAEYKLERVIIPQTGNKKYIYLLAFASVLVIIGVFMLSKKVLFNREELN